MGQVIKWRLLIAPCVLLTFYGLLVSIGPLVLMALIPYLPPGPGCDVDLSDEEIKALVVEDVQRFLRPGEHRYEAEDGLWTIWQPSLQRPKDADPHDNLHPYRVEVSFGDASFSSLVGPCGRTVITARTSWEPPNS